MEGAIAVLVVCARSIAPEPPGEVVGRAELLLGVRQDGTFHADQRLHEQEARYTRHDRMSDRSLPASATTGSLPMRVAVVEDDVALRGLVATVLDEANFHVEVCPLGWQAHLCIRKYLPKVVILDVQMPTVDGIELFYLLRADSMTASIPVIFLTANPGKVHHELPNYQDMGAVLLPKPFNLQELLDLVWTLGAT